MNRRTEQIESTLRREIGMTIERGLADPRIKGLVSVTSVHLTEDNRTAVVNVSVLPDEHGKTTVGALAHAATHIRTQIAKRIQTRQIPRLQFKLDVSLKKQAQVLATINEVMREDREDQPGLDEPSQEKSQ